MTRTENDAASTGTLRSINILQLSGRSDEGGGPRQAHTLSAGLKDRYRLHAALPDNGPYWDRFADLLGPGRLTRIGERRIHPSDVITLVHLIRREGIQLLHSHGRAAGLAGRLAATIARIPCVHTYHGLHFEGSQSSATRTGLARGVERLLSVRTTASIAVSVSEAELAIERRLVIGPNQLFTIPNGVASSPELPLSLEDRAPTGGRLRVALVLRANEQKNPEEALDILRHLDDQDALQSFEIACPEGDMNQLLLEVKARSLATKLQFLGPLQSCTDMFHRNHLLLSASRWEGLPLAALEAMALARPIVVSRVTGHVDLVDQDNPSACRLFAPGLPAEAAAALSQLTRSGSWLEAASAAYVAARSRHSLGHMIARTDEVYSYALAARS